MARDVALISTIGIQDADMIGPLLQHYNSYGVDSAYITLQAGEARSDSDLDRACDVASEGGAVVVGCHRGPWNADLNAKLRDRARARSGARWHLLADADEFQFHDCPVPTRIVELERQRKVAAVGLLLDRFSGQEVGTGDKGDVTALDAAYPECGFVGALVADAEPRKITLVRAGVEVGSGNHRLLSRTEKLDENLRPVHHFKWRASVVEKLAARRDQFAESEHPEEAAMSLECDRMLTYLHLRGGRLLPGPPGVHLGRGSLLALPAGWSEWSQRLWSHWQVERWASVGKEWWSARNPNALCYAGDPLDEAHDVTEPPC